MVSRSGTSRVLLVPLAQRSAFSDCFFLMHQYDEICRILTPNGLAQSSKKPTVPWARIVWLCFKNDFAANPAGLDENKRMQLPLHCSIHLEANWVEGGAVIVGC